jgi:hypothetical protein
MSFIQEMARIQDARDSHALQLVNHKWAPLVFTVLETAFTGPTKTVRATRLHTQVDAYLSELTALGFETPPNQDGRDLCLHWMQSQWLRRVQSEDGDEAYEMTSHALLAQRLIDGLTQERTLLSESRLTTILDAVRRAAIDANPDRERRLAALREQIDRLSAERDRLAGGGELIEASQDHMLNAFRDVADLFDQLPGEFRRVEEAVDRIHRTMIQDFRAETRPKGEVLDSYLERTQHLITETEEGRAFEGALAILSDEDLLTALKTDLRTILDHPFARHLDKAERLNFLGATQILRHGLQGVQAQQHKASRSLADHLSHHDTTQEREINAVLHEMQGELMTWMLTARKRTTVPLPWMPGKIEIGRLRTRLYDPNADKDVAALHDVSALAPAPPSMEELRRSGGPLRAAVRDGIGKALRQGRAETLGQAFDTLDDELRRPVELFGLLQLATDAELVINTPSRYETVTARRPDGSIRRLSIPVLAATAEQIDPEGDPRDG